MTTKQAVKILSAPRPPLKFDGAQVTDEWRKDRNRRKAARRFLRAAR